MSVAARPDSITVPSGPLDIVEAENRTSDHQTKPTLSAAWQQAAVVATILVLTTALARVGPGIFGRLFFVAAALFAAAFYIRRSPWQYVTLTFWFWTVTPLARRLIDYNTGFDPVNFVLATPNLMTVFMLRDVLTSRDLLQRREALVGLLLLLPMFYGLVLNYVQGDVVSGTVAAMDWFAPLTYYFFFIVNWRRIAAAQATVQSFLSVNGLFIIAYGIYQYFAPLPWDVAWVIDSHMPTIGYPAPYELRVFGTLNAPVTLAIWIGTLLLLFLHFRTRLSFLLVPSGTLLLLMTLVRSEAGTVVLGLLFAAFLGRASAIKLLGAALLAIIVIGMGLSIANPKVADQITSRFSTLNDLGTDDSALTRSAIYRAAPALIDANPFGMGIGALGRGAVATNHLDSVVVDSGPLAVYLSLGWIAGSVYLAGILVALIQAFCAARATPSFAGLALAVAAVAGAANLAFINITGFLAAIVWTCAAYAAALGIAGRERPCAVAIGPEPASDRIGSHFRSRSLSQPAGRVGAR